MTKRWQGLLTFTVKLLKIAGARNMDDADIQTDEWVWPFRFICGAMFGVAFSLPLGRSMVALGVVFMLIEAVRRRRMPVLSFAFWCWIAVLVLAVVAAHTGANPERSFSKIHKLYWFAAIPLAATVMRNHSERVRPLLRSFGAGCVVLALRIILWRPIEAWQAVRESVAAGGGCDYMWAITDLGSMTNGQMLMIGIIAVGGLTISVSGVEGDELKRVKRWYTIVLVLLSMALVVNLKRGSWICTLVVMGGFAATKLRMRHLLALAVLTVGIVLLPPVWCRLCSLKKEFDCSKGGRIVMWTKIAPPLIKDYPLGIGYRALTPELMKEVAESQGVVVESERDHLHSNPVQVLVSLGWAGLAVYLMWMGGAITGGVKLIRGEPEASIHRTEILSLVLMLAALIMNGLIEYNLGDAELVVPYAVLLGSLAGPRVKRD